MVVGALNVAGRWMRKLRSGQMVSYDDLPFSEVVALATALDEWEMVIQKMRKGK